MSNQPGSWGTGLTRHLTDAGVTVVEVDRPDPKARHLNGKTDTIDAVAAARAVISGRSTGIPKTRDGSVEAIRQLPGIKFNMDGKDDAWFIDGSEISQWSSAKQLWEQKSIVELSGKTKNCAYNAAASTCG